MRNTRGLFIGVGLFWSLASGALDAQETQLATAHFEEELQNTARISGHVLAGVQKRAFRNDEEDISLATYVPAAWAGGSLCLKVVSLDGRYEAVGEYDVATSWKGGIVRLSYPTKYSDMLQQRPEDGLGLRVARGLCTQDASEATVVYWNDPGAVPVTILVNSFQADAVYAYIGNDPMPVRCEPVDLDGRSAYDTRCPLSAVDAETPLDLEIVRIVNSKPAPSSHFKIWLPAE